MSTYIGVNNTAVKPSKIYVGVNGVAKKVKKIYAGVNGVAKVVYGQEIIIPFSTCPFPTSWTEITENVDYIATNTYGQWEIKTSINSGVLYAAFDQLDSTVWTGSTISSSGYLECCEIDCPNNTSILPTTFKIRYRRVGTSGSTIQGYNVSTDTWEDLATLWGTNNSITTQTLNVTTDNYYSKFRLHLTRYSSSYSAPHIIDLQVIAGIMKMGG